MYWYKFDSAEVELAERQALSQVDGASEDADASRNAKVVGNLGEYAFEAFLGDFAHPDRWEYVNEYARSEGEAEYEPYDFKINGRGVDVKSTTNLLKLHPTAMIMTSSDQPFHTISEDDKCDIYIFVLVDRGIWPLSNTENPSPETEAALIVGWATYDDLNREAFVDVARHSRGTDGVYLPFNDVYEILLRLGCTEPWPDMDS